MKMSDFSQRRVMRDAEKNNTGVAQYMPALAVLDVPCPTCESAFNLSCEFMADEWDSLVAGSHLERLKAWWAYYRGLQGRQHE